MILEPEGEVLRLHLSHCCAHCEVLQILLLCFYFETKRRQQVGSRGRRGALVAVHERVATDDGVHQRSGFLAGRGEVFPAERSLPGALDRGEETIPIAHALGASVLLYRDRVEEENLGKTGLLAGRRYLCMRR